MNNRNGEDEDVYVYGRPAQVVKAKIPVISALSWNGRFADKALLLRYAAALGQQGEGKNILYLTAGNTWQKGPVLAYLDVMYSRQGYCFRFAGRCSRSAGNGSKYRILYLDR